MEKWHTFTGRWKDFEETVSDTCKQIDHGGRGIGVRIYVRNCTLISLKQKLMKTFQIHSYLLKTMTYEIVGLEINKAEDS